jgi:hypothetical protein
MSQAPITAESREVWKFVQDLNRTWSGGQPEKLDSFFARDCVIVQPGFEGRATGRAACVESYVDFCAHANILGFQERAPDIDIFGDTAVVSYTFDISYELEGRRYREQGRDLFVLRRERGRWRAVWRTLLPNDDD